MHSSVIGRWLALSCFVAGLGVAGCDCNRGGAGDSCDTNADCDPGLVCEPVSGTCAASGGDAGGSDSGGGGVDSGTDSGGGTDAGTDAGPIVLLPTGAACTDASECEGTLTPTDAAQCLLPLFGFPGGYCTNADCDLVAQDCPGTDAMCLGDPTDSFCADICDPAAPDCRPGYSCFDVALLGGGTGGPFACLPMCLDDGDCDTVAGESCDNGAGGTFTCYQPGATVGDPCIDNTDCGPANLCFSETLIGFPGGYCVEPCDPTAGVTTCPTGSTCQGLDMAAPTDGMCFDDCNGGMGTGCRVGYACDDVLALFGMLGQNQCVPDCQMASDCTTPGYECEVVFGLCQLPLDPELLGDPCALPVECLGGLCGTEADFGAPMGECLDECDPTQSVAGDCPTGGTCVDLTALGLPIGLCFLSCDPAADTCRDGYGCTMFPLTTDDVCLPDCDSSTQCTSGCCEASLFGGTCVDPGGAPPPMCL